MRKGASKSRITFHKREVRRVNGRRIKEKRAASPLVRTQYWTRRQRLRVLCQHMNKHETTTEESMARVSKLLSDLRLPFLAPHLQQSELSDQELLTQLRWLIDPQAQMWPREDQLKYQPHQEILLNLYSRREGPFWNLPPTREPDFHIYWYIVRLSQAWTFEARLPLPSNWPVFSGIQLGDFFSLDPTDSRTDPGRDYLSMTASHEQRAQLAARAKEYRPVSIKCVGKGLNRSRLRSQWELLESMDPSHFGWNYQTEEGAHQQDELRHAGMTDFNQTSLNQDIWPQQSILALLHVWDCGEADGPMECDTLFRELEWPQRLGRLIAGIVSTDEFPAESLFAFQWPTLLSQIRQPPLVDYVCRAKRQSRSPLRDLDLLLFAVQYKSDDERAAVHLLAKAFQPMITLFILYYLDVRTSRDDLMPWWMVLFGIIYDDEGIYIQSFYPAFNSPKGEASEGTELGWKANSWNVSRSFTLHIRHPPYNRNGLFASLYRIQGHCKYVLEQLRQWDGYERASAKVYS